MYQEAPINPNFGEMEKRILKYWQDGKIFEKSIEDRPDKIETQNNEYVFYDGPPFANGLPHYGHLLTGFIKDIFPRYQTMQGKKVDRRFGWDCHGLPAEMGAEKELNISGRVNIKNYGIDKFNDQCRKSVMKFTGEWEEYVTRQGRWVDFKRDYKTMDKSYMESVLWAFKELYDKGLVYEDMRVMPYSWACETPLSNFETRMDNSYRERADKAITVLFTLDKLPAKLEEKCESAKILAWTTTPWTLPSNLALAVSPILEYACIIKEGVAYIIGKSAFEIYRKDLKIADDYTPEIMITGEELYNLTYQPLFDYFKDHENAFRILCADFVEEGSGTGVVHIAPGFGEDDHVICQKENISLVCPVDESGKFTTQVSDFAELNIFDANDEIIKFLKLQGDWLKTEQYIHNYPHCWRTDTPLIYKALPSWYVEVTKFKDRMVELNQQINWIPGNVKDGLFGKWLENARDWSISRNRFWGTPIPIWKSDNPAYPRIDVYGSIAELERDFGVTVTDLHRPFIDELTRVNPDDPSCKSMMRRVEDVFDCWFESGSMPYGQVHYPFENKEWFENHFPADFIVEYVAQTRGWFYTLMVLSTALFDRPPFLNCICHGVILDEKGQKLSKRLNNYANPLDMFEKYGSDSVRWLMISSPVMRGSELLIDKDGKMITDAQRAVLKPIWNSYYFFILYANADNITANEITSSSHFMDQYILGKLQQLTVNVANSLDTYDTIFACERVEKFLDILNNWYIRRSKLRFWKSEKDTDKFEAYNTLYTILINLMKIVAPLLPFISEEIYQNLTGNVGHSSSIHLEKYPSISCARNMDLEQSMDKIQDICNVAHAIRNDLNIRVRQPLSKIIIAGKSLENIGEYSNLIADEINVKQVEIIESFEEYASYKLKVNYNILGKRIPQKVKNIIAYLKNNSYRLENGKIFIDEEEILESEYEMLLEPTDAKSGKALSTKDAVILLDTEITDELYNEGIVRDFVRAIQQARKDQDFNITDKISIRINAEKQIFGEILLGAKNYIEEQTLSTFAITQESYHNDIILDNVKIQFELLKI